MDIYFPEAILPGTCRPGADVLPFIYDPNRSERAKETWYAKRSLGSMLFATPISWHHTSCRRISNETACNVWHGADLDSSVLRRGDSIHWLPSFCYSQTIKASSPVFQHLSASQRHRQQKLSAFNNTEQLECQLRWIFEGPCCMLDAASDTDLERYPLLKGRESMGKWGWKPMENQWRTNGFVFLLFFLVILFFVSDKPGSWRAVRPPKRRTCVGGLILQEFPKVKDPMLSPSQIWRSSWIIPNLFHHRRNFSHHRLEACFTMGRKSHGKTHRCVPNGNPHVGRDIGGVDLKIASHCALTRPLSFFGRSFEKKWRDPQFINQPFLPPKMGNRDIKHIAWCQGDFPNIWVWERHDIDLFERCLGTDTTGEKKHLGKTPLTKTIPMVASRSFLTCQYDSICIYLEPFHCSNVVNQKRFQPDDLVPLEGVSNMIQWPDMHLRLTIMGCSPKISLWINVNHHFPLVSPSKTSNVKNLVANWFYWSVLTAPIVDGWLITVEKVAPMLTIHSIL